MSCIFSAHIYNREWFIGTDKWCRSICELKLLTRRMLRCVYAHCDSQRKTPSSHDFSVIYRMGFWSLVIMSVRGQAKVRFKLRSWSELVKPDEVFERPLKSGN